MPAPAWLLTSAVGLLLVLSGCAGEPDGPAPTASTDDGCPQVQVVGVRGQSQSLRANRGLGVEVNRVVLALQEDLAERGVDDVAVAPVRHESRASSDPTVYDADVDAGRERLTTLLRSTTAACPDARLVVVGFSQGAQIAQETLADEPGLARQVDALGLIGSPRHDPDSTFTQVDLPGPRAELDGSLGAGPDLGALDARTVDACLALDVVCDADGGTDYTVHKTGYEDPRIGREIARALAEVLR